MAKLYIFNITFQRESAVYVLNLLPIFIVIFKLQVTFNIILVLDI